MDPEQFFKQIKEWVYDKKFSEVLKDEVLKYDTINDHNKIVPQILFKYLLKTLKMMILIMLITYFMGILFFVWMEITQHEDEDAFRSKHGIDAMSPSSVVIVMMYWAFTTLSTVGFGDYYPISDSERGIMCFGFLAGVAIFTFVNGAF